MKMKMSDRQKREIESNKFLNTKYEEFKEACENDRKNEFLDENPDFVQMMLHEASKIQRDEDYAWEEIAHEITSDRAKIIELFCKTFAISQGVCTADQLRELFMHYELVCTLGDSPLHQTFRFQLREFNHPTPESIHPDEDSERDKSGGT
jgi:hypothetical protein